MQFIRDGSMKLTEKTNNFAVVLYQAISKNGLDNIIISPISLQCLLILVLQGAKGATASEIANILNLPENKNLVLSAQKKMILGLNNSLLNIRTKLFSDKAYPLSKDFLDVITMYFLSEAHVVDLNSNSTEWGEEALLGIEEKINQKNEISPVMESDTECINLHMMSEVYLNFNWKHKSEKCEMLDMPFYINTDLIIITKMIYLKESRLCNMYSRKLEAQILEIPSMLNKLRMIIILPKKQQNITDVESKLAFLDLSEELAELWISKVNVYLPRFKFNQTEDLTQVLSQMGMTTAFSKEADFSGISSNPLTIRQITQKVYIELQEETEECNGMKKTPIFSSTTLFKIIKVSSNETHYRDLKCL